MVQYVCEGCGLTTTDKSRYTKHLNSKKHKTMEQQRGIRESSLEQRLQTESDLVKQQQEEIQRLKAYQEVAQNQIVQLVKQVKVEAREEKALQPTPIRVISEKMSKSYVNKPTEDSFEELNNEPEDIMRMKIENIRGIIPFFKVYMDCRKNGTLDPLNGFITKHFKEVDYKIENDELIFYDYEVNDEGNPIKNKDLIDTDNNHYSINLLRKGLGKQIVRCEEYYKYWCNQFRRKDQDKYDTCSNELSLHYNIFDSVLSEKKSLTKEYFKSLFQKD